MSSGEYILYILIAVAIGLSIAALVTMFVLNAVAGIQVTFWEAIAIDLVASVILSLFALLLKGLAH